MDTMSPQKGYYCLIQYCPDPSRAEAVNVGVLLFCPALRFLEARMTQNNKRVLRLFGPHAVDRVLLDFGKRSICNRLRVEADRFLDVADLEHFVNTRANDWRLTPPRSMRVTDPMAQLEGLFRELVEAPTPTAGAAAGDRPEVLRELDTMLEKPTLRAKVRRDERVTVPVVERELRAPYAFENGVLNLIVPHKVGTREGTRSVEILAFEGGVLLQRSVPTEGKAPRLIVIPYADGADRGTETVAKAREILGAANVRTYTREELDLLEREIEAVDH